jgi:F-box interacting protein
MKVIQSCRCRSISDDDGVCVSLPENVVFDVLVRLPLKALCRFRCVSKAWRTLISDPGFVAAQRSHAGPLIVGVFGWGPDHELRVLDTHGDVLRVFEVKESAMLAPTRLDLICVDRMRLGAMIVDPAARRAFTVGRDVDRWSNFSFGRATPSGAYKVLRFYETPTTVCEVATITDDGAEPTWRQRPPPTTCFSSKHRATVNGVLYFMPYMTYATTPVWNRVAGFDLESEVWMETIKGPPLGPEVDHELGRIALTELKGALCMVHIDNIKYADYVGGLRLYANVWRLTDYNKSVWVKAYTIRMPTECLHIQVLDVLEDGRILLLSSKLKGRSRFPYVLQFFNPSTEAFTDIKEMAEGLSEGLSGGGTMTLYTGSLLSS